jgi:hypothetical protein
MASLMTLTATTMVATTLPESSTILTLKTSSQSSKKQKQYDLKTAFLHFEADARYQDKGHRDIAPMNMSIRKNYQSFHIF